MPLGDMRGVRFASTISPVTMAMPTAERRTRLIRAVVLAAMSMAKPSSTLMDLPRLGLLCAKQLRRIILQKS
jgi:hypothetical protein